MPSSDVPAHCVERVLIVTGASRGIGASTAVLAAQDGFKVCVNFCKQKQRAESVVRQIADAGGHAISVQADVTDEAAVIKMFETVDRELGPVTALVNNAGINHIAQGRIDSCTQEELKKLFDTNVVSAFLCSREAIKRMSTNHGGGGGAIVNLSSTLVRTAAAGRFIPYGASKAAIEAFTTGLSQEVAGEGIRVNAVVPGAINSDMLPPDRLEQIIATLPMGRVGEPEEVASAIVWLLSNEASYVSGAHLGITGAR